MINVLPRQGSTLTGQAACRFAIDHSKDALASVHMENLK
jgi:hypothetical protein